MTISVKIAHEMGPVLHMLLLNTQLVSSSGVVVGAQARMAG